MMSSRSLWPLLPTLAAFAMVAGCAKPPQVGPADTLIVNGRVYTFNWNDPSLEGTPDRTAPHTDAGWRPDAEALALRDGRIVFVGSSAAAQAYRGPSTRVIDLGGATALPGLVDSHVHIRELGQTETYLDLTGVQTEEEAVARVESYAARVPTGEWIIGRGWDEGAWANRYPTMTLLSQRVPNHPVVLGSLHGFAIWGNKLAFARAGITRATKAPVGGVIVKDAKGEPSGTLLNRATPLLQNAVPPPSAEQTKAWVRAGLMRMARDGYVAVHEAGADAALMTAFESLRAAGDLPTRVYAMLSAREPDLCRAWLAKGPLVDDTGMLTVRSVKAYYDGALGSRGARLLEDYSDQKGHRGVSGGSYGFDQTIVADMMKAGFQVGVHAIGDAGNRETLDFIESVEAQKADVRLNRNRIEHAQVVHPDDFARFASLQVIASMEPPHAVEDKGWAEDRLGPERVKGAYAWRTFRKAGVRLIFNSDLTGSDHSIFYGLHAAITRRDKALQPSGGWHPEQRMTPEEAVRGYSTWAAYAAFVEKETGVLAPGRWADVTVMDVDPMVVGSTRPEDLLKGSIRLTMVGGRVVYEGSK
jgi:predicted amidohydrolase YtcJ